ncbi:MAG: amino acid permease [Phycisphaerae bacterium]
MVRMTQLRRSIGFWGAVAIMVGIMIGSGIFQTPPEIAKHIGSPWLTLGLWTLGGLISLCGALTYAELATMYPHAGGVYVFLREGFGRMTAFVFGWTYLLISKPAAAAGIAIVFASHVNTLLGVQWDVRVITCTMLLCLTIINTFHVSLGSGVAIALTVLKTAALAAIAALGAYFAARHAAPTPASISIAAPLWLSLAPAMSAILWTYDGWSDAGAIAEEIKDPQRRLPRVFVFGTAATAALYVAVNAVYMGLIPLDEMRGVSTVAPLVTQRLLGDAGATFVTLVVLVSTLGSTHGSIITGARVSFAQARDGLLFRFLGRVSPAFGTPAVSLWFQLALSCIAVYFLETFDRMANSFVFTMWIFYGLAGAAVIVLRRKQPERQRPYRCWGYPFVPLVFIASAVAMTVLSILGNPRETLPWIGVLLAGVPVYWAWKKAGGAGAPASD